jgi:CarD family transcriptional regulator
VICIVTQASPISERQIYESARDRLASELAAVEKLDMEAATKRLEKVLEAA